MLPWINHRNGKFVISKLGKHSTFTIKAVAGAEDIAVTPGTLENKNIILRSQTSYSKPIYAAAV